MPLLSLGKAAYKRGDGPDVPLVNLLFEQDPRNIEDQTSLIQRPGLGLLVDLGEGKRRAIYRQAGVMDGDFLVVVGEELYRVTPAGTPTLLGDIPGADICIIAGNASIAFIAANSALYSTDGETVTEVEFPDDAGCVAVACLNGFFVFVRQFSHRLYWLRPGETEIDPLDFLSAEIAPDYLVHVISTGDELVLPGDSTTEVWGPTTDPDAPFQRIAGRLFPVGCSNRDSIGQVGSTIFMVGEDRQAGGRIAIRIDSTPTRISDNYIDQKLRAPDAIDLIGWTLGFDGHTLWSLNTGAETLVFDLSTNIWTTFASHGLPQWRASLGAPRGDGLVLAGDTESGKLWLLDPALNQDDGQPMERTWPARLQLKGPLRIFNIVLECTVGFAPLAHPDDDPMVEMRHSDDLAQTWSDWEAESLGRQGEYDAVPSWDGLGLFSRPGADFQFRVTSNVRVTVRQAEYSGSLR